jgi:predicted acylesterase/phospholipase RssA
MPPFGGFSVGLSLRLEPFKNTVFAGGGNRCWWQAGLITRFAEKGIRLPPNLMGTSAGAAIAAAYIVHRIPEALYACIKLYRQNESNMRWVKLRQLKIEFAHHQIYPRMDRINHQGCGLRNHQEIHGPADSRCDASSPFGGHNT